MRRFRFLPARSAVPPKPPNQVRSCNQERYAGPGGEQSPPWITEVKSRCQSSRQAGYPNNDSNQLRQRSRSAHGFLLSVVIWLRQDFCRSTSRRFLERALGRKRGIACGKNYFRPPGGELQEIAVLELNRAIDFSRVEEGSVSTLEIPNEVRLAFPRSFCMVSRNGRIPLRIKREIVVGLPTDADDVSIE